MERGYARALMLAGPTLVGAAFLAFALYEVLRPLIGSVFAAAVTGALFMAPAAVLARRPKTPGATMADAVAGSAAAANQRFRNAAQAAAGDPLGTAASALDGVGRLFEPGKRKR
ncbi:hypothetical protein L2U69_16270 [Zavarzinia compransoris]|uniref:hypothetical protein n=1 Tax=Zavarzinia marina TaxID=2911065 RepID=UPI001F45700B|nr:hypothetical protein [Zavarzinia marina]MCF4167205.1 hypothetical protein [Zavarzinia marina]